MEKGRSGMEGEEREKRGRKEDGGERSFEKFVSSCCQEAPRDRIV